MGSRMEGRLLRKEANHDSHSAMSLSEEVVRMRAGIYSAFPKATPHNSARANPEKNWVLMKAVFRRNTLCISRKSDKIRAQIFQEVPKAFAPPGIIGEEGPRLIRYMENEMNNDTIIRLEKPEEYRQVENLVRESFWNVYRPGCSEHYVIHVLRDDPAFVPELDFVMYRDGQLIGQNMFMRTIIEADDGRVIPILTMGPIGITPELKRKGYGKKLLDYSLERAEELGFGAVLFEGNIGFYGKCGFDYARKFGIRYHDLPEGADDSFFLCRELIPGYLDGVTGIYQTPQGYYVDDADVEAFDRSFPPKEKLKLPGQIFG